MDSCRLFQVLVESRKHRECSAISLDSLLFSITRDAERSLNAYSRSASPALKLHAEHRLAFRELGLSIGIHAIELMQQILSENKEVMVNQDKLDHQLKTMVEKYRDLAPRIEDFWLDPSNRATHSWKAHEDINSVMLATSLAPEGFLALSPRKHAPSGDDEHVKRA